MRSSTCRATLAFGLLALSCAADPPGPRQTVESYLRALAHDPLRTLPLLTDAFHLRHGLRFENAVATSHFEPGETAPSQSGEIDAELEIERARLGWLMALSRPTFGVLLPTYRIRWGPVREQASRARVQLRIQAARTPPIAFAFSLIRDGAEFPWRIDAIAARPPESEDEGLLRFMVAPNADGARVIQQIERRNQG